MSHPSPIPRIALAALLLAAASCAGPPEARNVLPELSAGDVDPSAGYEPLPTRRAADLLPPELLDGPHHRVRDAVGSDGFLNLYVIDSDFGTFEAAGDDLLRIRLHEIGALAELDRMQKREEFAKAMGEGLKSPFVAAWNLIRDPVDSILGIPQAAWDGLQKTAELTRRERGELEDSGFREFIGFESKKRELACQLGVDPYTSNGELQKQLNRFAWAAYLGGLPFALVPFQDAPEGAEIRPPSEDADQRLRDILRHYAPEDLRRLNRIELAVMGVHAELADRFLAQPWFSPRHGTILVGSLVALDLAVDRPVFIETALVAGSEADARFYQRAAELLRAWHERRTEVARITAGERAVMGLTIEDGLVVPLAVDHAVWSRPAEAIAERVAAARDATGAGRARLLVSGTLSERARAGFARHGIEVTERAFEQLAPRVAGAAR